MPVYKPLAIALVTAFLLPADAGARADAEGSAATLTAICDILERNFVEADMNRLDYDRECALAQAALAALPQDIPAIAAKLPVLLKTSQTRYFSPDSGFLGILYSVFPQAPGLTEAAAGRGDPTRARLFKPIWDFVWSELRLHS